MKSDWIEETWNPVVSTLWEAPGCDPKILMVFDERALKIPLQNTQKPMMYLVNSMGDLFYEKVPFSAIAKVFGIMALAKRHTFQILTKYPDQVLKFQEFLEGRWPFLFPSGLPDSEMDSNVLFDFLTDEDAGCQVSSENFPQPWPLPNVWIGTSVRGHDTLHRIDTLRSVPAVMRFVSLEEPKAGDLRPLNFEGIGLVFVGDKSERGWLSSIIDQCSAANIPCFMREDYTGEV